MIFTKRLFVVLLIIGSSGGIFSQNQKSLKVTYVKEVHNILNDSVFSDATEALSGLNTAMIDQSEDIRFELLVANKRSLFRAIPSLISNGDPFVIKSLIRSFGGTRGVFFISQKDAVFINQKHYAENHYRVKLKPKKWHKTNESKYIQSYKCYKATSIDTVVNPAGVFYFKVEAWFSPELPHFFGPAEYFGLPGLVLELNNSKISLKAIEVKLDEALDEIHPPKEGVLISKKEYVDHLNRTAKDELMKLFKH